jgi:hypothetical protein
MGRAGLRGRHLVAGLVRAARGLTRDENAIEADEFKNFRNAVRCVDDCEFVARHARLSVEGDENGDAGGVDAFDVLHVECDGLFAHDGLQLFHQPLFFAAHEFMQIALNGDRPVHNVLIIACHKKPPLKRPSAAPAGKAE